MLRKLMKHEFLASYRVHVSLYLGVLVLSLISMFSFQFEREVFAAMIFGLLMLTIGALSVFTLYNIVVSMYGRVYGKPGYLLFSTPAKTWEIMVAKVVINVFWLFMTTFVSLLAFYLFFIVVVPDGFLQEISGMFAQFIQVDYPFWIALGVQVFVGLLYQIGFFAFLFALLNLIYKGEKKLLMGFLLYFGLNYVVNGVVSLFSTSMVGFEMDMIDGILRFDSSQLWAVTAVYLVAAVILYGVTYYWMDRKLELQ
jgi:hypothetical protein